VASDRFDSLAENKCFTIARRKRLVQQLEQKLIQTDMQVTKFSNLDSHRTAIKTSELALPKKIVVFQNTDSRLSQTKYCVPP